MADEKKPASGDWPDDGARGPAIAGLVLCGFFFGVIGTWAAFAPLDSAAIAAAVIKVQGNRKSVQHLEGGIVREMRVRENESVEAGQVMIVLDNAQAQAADDILRKQVMESLSREARLKAERAGAATITFPKLVEDSRSDPETAAVMQGETALFQSRRATLQGQMALTRKKIAQTRELISGLRGQHAAQKKQLESTREEYRGLKELFDRGYVPRQRMMELDRQAASFEGQVVDSEAQLVRLSQQVEELNLQIEQIQGDRMQQVDAELRDVQAKLAETLPRLQAARDVLERVEIRAPYSGRIVGLSVFGKGSVIGRGDKLMDIVPHTGGLVVEANVGVDDIRDVKPGMRAEVRLTAFKQRTTPIVFGSVSNVSADRLTDSRTGIPYYLVQISIDENELKKAGDLKLIPGMAAEVAIPTGKRTALDYLVGPITDSVNRSFRER